MRQTRKVLSFVLILALVMGSFSMVFAAGTTNSSAATLSDIAGLIGEDQIEVCQNLGIIEGMPNGTYEPETLVNRAQFAAIITRALGIPDSALAGYATSNFNDTAGYGWAIPYLAFCQSKGIMIGDGQGNAMPGRTITVNEAVTMILRAIGYIDSAAELVGVWPANYVTLGKALGLYDDLANDVYMDRENAAIAIYNALTIQLVAIDSDGKTDYRKDAKGVAATLATTGLGCEVDNEFQIDNSWFGNSLINITDKLGAHGAGYTNKDKELVAFKADPNFGFITGTIDGDKLKALDGKKYSFAESANNSVSGYFNAGDVSVSTAGMTSAGVSLSDLNMIKVAEKFISDNETDGDEITVAAEVSGLTIRNVYALVGWQATDAEVIAEGQVKVIEEDKEILGRDFVTDDEDEIDMKQFSLIGVQSLSDIKTDDVVYVYTDGDDVRRVAVGQTVVEGIIDEASEDEFIVDGKTYEYAFDYLKGTSGASTNAANDAGADVVARLDAYGYAFDIDTTGGDVGTFGIVIAKAKENVRAAEVRLYISDDAEKTFSMPKLSKIDVYNTGETGAKKVNSTATAIEGNFDAELAIGKLFGYKLNSSGEINVFEPAVQGVSDKVTIKSKSVLVNDGKTITIDKNAVVFSVEGNVYNGGVTGTATIATAEYEIATLDDIDLKAATDIDAQYVLNKKGDKVIALLLPEAVVDADADDVYGVINTMTNVKVGGDDAYRLNGYFDGTSGSLNTADKDSSFDEYDKEQIGLFRITKNNAGNAKSMVNVADDPDSDLDSKEARIVTEYNQATSSSAISTANNTIKDVDGVLFPVESDATVYKAEYKSGKYTYTSSSLGSIKNNSYFWAYDTQEADDVTGNSATVVIWVEKASSLSDYDYDEIEKAKQNAADKEDEKVQKANQADVDVVLDLITAAAFEMDNVDVTDEDAIKDAIADIIDGLALNGVDYEIEKVSYTEAIDAEEETSPGAGDEVVGVDGTYTFKVKLTKGTDAREATATTETLTMTIKYTPYE